ncbi:MAG TPA: hypothetical protein PK876_09960 [Elusimicrobiota bacterium]|nr:hypothetical protein [Elusimicrobiota bacterium]
MNFLKKWFQTAHSNQRQNLSGARSAVPFDSQFMEAITTVEAQRLVDIGLRPKEIKKVPLNKLYVQFRSEWPIQERGAIPGSVLPLPVCDSPLCLFLESYKKHGLAVLSGEHFKENPYYKMWQAVNQVGFRYDWFHYPQTLKKQYSDKDIENKMRGLINTYESIKTHGYLGGEYKNRMVMALETPFENTRLGHHHSIDGYEIWGGHHRVAAMISLGYSESTIMILSDQQHTIVTPIEALK